MCQLPVDVGGVVAADEATVFLVALLTMVGHIDDDGIFLLESFHDLCHDGVVVEGGVVVMTQYLALGIGQLWALVFVAACPELSLALAIAQLVVYVLTHQMENGEIMVGLELFQTVIIIFQQSIVQCMQLGVSVVELQLAQFRIVQEEAAAEVIYRLLSLRQEFVGDEGYVVSCLAEYLREERIVAPFSLVAYHIGREHVLEYEACEVPAGHDICKLGEFLRFLQRRLVWGGFHEVAILL